MKKYNSLNGLRTIACIGIILMHIVSNINFKFKCNIFDKLFSNFTNFVFLFLVISSFSMCCGYFRKIYKGEISLSEFYNKRFQKILPIFLFLVIVDILVEHSFSALAEGFADITLLFGFLPNKINVIGVGWFIGLITLFYMIFPFFTYIISKKKRLFKYAIISIVMNVLCIYYFKVDRTNMFYSFVYLILGGIIFRFKKEIINFCSKYKNQVIALCLFAPAIFIILPENELFLNFEMLFLSFLWVSYAISFDSKILNNKVTRFISRISLEMYLSHMMIFRLISKINILKLISNKYIYLCTISVLVISLTICFSTIFQLVQSKYQKKEY